MTFPKELGKLRFGNHCERTYIAKAGMRQERLELPVCGPALVRLEIAV
jgi:hypothetical protein